MSDTPPGQELAEPEGQLRREIGLGGAILMGLGSMIGTGAFVSIGIAAGIAGPAVLLAIVLAALVATCNALSSAQLAAANPVSGGTYEYGYRYLSSWFGFTAGWMFLWAKTASAATAALGFAGYLTLTVGLESWAVPAALIVIGALTAVVLGGISKSNRVNALIVAATIACLVFFVAGGLISLRPGWHAYWTPFFGPTPDGFVADTGNLLQATALMFVAFAGYARIATLGEEVHEPQRTIPLAIISTLALCAVIYLAVAAVAVATVGPDVLARAAQDAFAPLQVAASIFTIPGATIIITLGALTALLSVLLNLILGLSRMLLAMARRADMPERLAVINAEGSPMAAVIAVGVAIAALALIGDVKLTWSFSAFTILVYYAVTNLAALRMPAEERLFPPIVAWAGLASCLALAFWVEWRVWLVGLALIAAGLAWHGVARRLSPPAEADADLEDAD